MEPHTTGIEVLMRQITDDFLSKLKLQVSKQIAENINFQLSKMDVSTLVREHISSMLNPNSKTYNFPNRSIHGSAINPDGLFIKADQIATGILRNLESTGIQDKATETQVTILDNATVFENQLVAKTLHVAGNATVEGDLNITGTVPVTSKLFADVVKHSAEAMKGELKNGIMADYSEQVLTKLRNEGIDPTVINYQGHKLIKDNTLAPTVMFSNLQKVGALKELQVIGETLLDETIYVSNGRMGVNTIEPEAALDLWDQEIEIQIGKFEKDYGFIGTPKAQSIVLSANKHQNLTLNTDGSVTVSAIKIGGIRQSSSDIAPTSAAPRGDIVWNSNPKIDDPIGWVSLGNARWASFGTVTV